MRFTIALVGAFAAAAVAQSGSATKSEVPSPTVSLDPTQSAIFACINACDVGDVECQSHCVAVPSPDENQVNDTTECMAECEQGNGTEAETARYAKCQQDCISQHFFVTSSGTPRPTGGASSGGSDSDDSAESSDSPSGSITSGAARPSQSSSDSEDEDSTQTSSSPTSDATDAATETPAPDSGASTLVGSSAVIFGLLAAVLAL